MQRASETGSGVVSSQRRGRGWQSLVVDDADDAEAADAHESSSTYNTLADVASILPALLSYARPRPPVASRSSLCQAVFTGRRRERRAARSRSR